MHYYMAAAVCPFGWLEAVALLARASCERAGGETQPPQPSAPPNRPHLNAAVGALSSGAVANPAASGRDDRSRATVRPADPAERSISGSAGRGTVLGGGGGAFNSL